MKNTIFKHFHTRIPCRRCGSKVDPSEWSGFRCSRCTHIKIEREFLEPIITQLKENFHRAKTSKYGSALKYLYVFGGYLRGNAQCTDIDIVFTYDKSKMDQYIDWYLGSYTKNVLKRSYNGENSEIDGKRLLQYLDKSEFWDFRKCDEYPDCLVCFSDEGCLYEEINGDESLQPHEVSNYCIEKCNSIEQCNFGIPSCYIFPNECVWMGDKNTFRNAVIRSYLLDNLGKIIRKDADVQFERSGLRVKVLLLNHAESIEKVIEKYPNLNLKSKGAIKQIA